MSKVKPSPPDEVLGGFSKPPEGDYVAALLEPAEKGFDAEEAQRRESMSPAEMRKVPVKAAMFMASISRGDEAGGRASLYCGLTKQKGQMNFLRFIAGTGLASTIEQKYPDLGPIEEGWDDAILTSRKFFDELCTTLPGHEVNITIKHSGDFANIIRVWPISGGSVASSQPPSNEGESW